MNSFHLVTEEKDLMTLSKTLFNGIPRSSMIYNVLKLKLQLKAQQINSIRIDIFAHNQNFTWNETDQDYFFVSKINVEGLPQTLVVMHANHSPAEEQLNALEELIVWSEMNQFEGIENSISDFIKRCCEKYGRGLFHDPIEMYFLSLSDALSFEETKLSAPCINHTAKVSNLTLSDAAKINEVWPAACPGSLEMIQASIESIGSGGIYIGKDADGNDVSPNACKALELISWAVALPFGSIHALYTETDYQKRGYGGLTMRMVSKAVASLGRIPLVQIYKTNDTSKSVNIRVGYTFSHDINLIHYFPSNE